MKKSSFKRTILVGVLTIALLFVFVACSGESENVNTNNGQDVNNEQQVSTVVSTPEQTPSKTEERIELTTSNINDYLTFNVRVSDVEVEETIMDNEMGECYLTMKSSSKKAVEYDGVVLTIRFATTSSGWPNSAEHTIEIPYDGKTEYSTDTSSYIKSYVSTSPSFKVEVISVQGYATKK